MSNKFDKKGGSFKNFINFLKKIFLARCKIRKND